MSSATRVHRKAMASLTMLVSWTIWNERNARIFRSKFKPPNILFINIKSEAKLWVTTRPKDVGLLMPGVMTMM